MLRSCALSSSNFLTRSALVEKRGSGARGPRPSNSSRVAISNPKPGSCARCVASSPSVRDLAWGRQSSLPLGMRSSMRRVVASSDSRSGNRSAIGGGCLPDVLALRADFVGDFLADPLGDFLADFLADLVDFLADLERADFLAMNL